MILNVKVYEYRLIILYHMYENQKKHLDQFVLLDMWEINIKVKYQLI
jgi:hypothetical protein